MKRKRKPILNLGSADNVVNTACRSCGKAVHTIRCKACHTKFETWMAEGEEPKSSPEAYVPRHSWDDLEGLE